MKNIYEFLEDHGPKVIILIPVTAIIIVLFQVFNLGVYVNDKINPEPKRSQQYEKLISEQRLELMQKYYITK